MPSWMYYDNIIVIYTPTLGIISEEYGGDNVTVSVEWTQQVGTEFYVRVLPSVTIMVTGSTSRQLIILYNMEYNLSVEAIAPCRANAITFIRLHYGEL